MLRSSKSTAPRATMNAARATSCCLLVVLSVNLRGTVAAGNHEARLAIRGGRLRRTCDRVDARGGCDSPRSRRAGGLRVLGHRSLLLGGGGLSGPSVDRVEAAPSGSGGAASVRCRQCMIS